MPTGAADGLAIDFRVDGITYDHVAGGVDFEELLLYRQGTWPELSWRVVGGTPSAGDPFEGRAIEMWLDAEGGGPALRFRGRCVRMSIQYGEAGWTREYSAYGLRWLGDTVPHVDPITGADSTAFNRDRDDLDYLAGRAGRSAGRILAAVLGYPGNAAGLLGLGIGNYSSAGSGATGTASLSGSGVAAIAKTAGGSGYDAPPTVALFGGGGSGALAEAIVSGGVVTGFAVTAPGSGYTSPPEVLVSPLPAATLADLAGMEVTVPHPYTFGGERLLEAVEGAVRALAPNYHFDVAPDGLMRFFDLRTPRVTLPLALGVRDGRGRVADPGSLAYTRSIEHCAGRVLVTGEALVEGMWLGLKPAPGSAAPDNGLAEEFAHSGLTSDQAKALYRPEDFAQPDGDAGRAKLNASVDASGAVAAIAIQYPGYGYGSPPPLTITPRPGAGAQYAVEVAGGAVVNLTLASGGSGYDGATPPTITFVGGGGSGASATPTRNAAGVITGFANLIGGSGYATAPTAVVAGPGAGSGASATLALSAGRVAGVLNLVGGSGYKVAPACTVTLPNGGGADSGTCTAPTASTVEVTSGDPFKGWPANYWDQSPGGRKGTVFLVSPTVAGLEGRAEARVVANTALAPGGTSTLTLDRPLPNLTFAAYRLTGLAAGGSVVYTRYRVVDPEIGGRLAPRFPFARAIGNSDGTAISLTSFPVMRVLHSSTGQRPYFESPIAATFDPLDGTITAARPTVSVFGAVPADVQAFVAVYKGTLRAAYPPDVAGVPRYEGTASEDRGVERTLRVHVPAWRDPGNSAAMLAYAKDLHDTVKDVGHDVSLEVRGPWDEAFAPGAAAEASGSGWASGLEGLALPILECSLRWGRGGTKHRSRVRLSNRRAHFSAESYLAAPPTGESWGGFDDDMLGSLGGLVDAGGMMGGGGFGAAVAGAQMGAFGSAFGAQTGAFGPGEGDR